MTRIGEERGVEAEEDLDALAGPARALGRVNTGGQPEGDARMTQVVRPPREFKGQLVESSAASRARRQVMP
ncbi:hypothetical protein IHE55_28365 [Streptomyces pactum]|uniref:Uncharacterized protein n=2 Tax=Streptomyces pactum TaxID=68249 RepID=A0ABS0NTL6_9ACTN|nr:hypothetical protein [Streptomyces pactum]